MPPPVPDAPLTAPVANALVMVPLFTAASPPAVPFAPRLMTPVAQVWPAPQAWFSAGTAVPAIALRFSPTSPPTKLNAPPLTVPLAEEAVMVPRLVAARPPATLKGLAELEL